MKKYFLLILVTYFCTCTSFPMDCDEWQQTFASYEKELYAAINDEPEDIVQEIEWYLKAKSRNSTERMEKIASKTRLKLENLEKVIPPDEFDIMHSQMVECHRYAVAVIDAEEAENRTDSLEGQIEMWKSLREFFLSMKVFLVEYNCNPGDIESLDKKYLPHIKKMIEKLESEIQF